MVYIDTATTLQTTTHLTWDQQCPSRNEMPPRLLAATAAPHPLHHCPCKRLWALRASHPAMDAGTSARSG